MIATDDVAAGISRGRNYIAIGNKGGVAPKRLLIYTLISYIGKWFVRNYGKVNYCLT